MRRWSLLPLILLAACARGQTTRKQDPSAAPIRPKFEGPSPIQDAREIDEARRRIHGYASTLLLFRSDDPADWDEAFKTIDEKYANLDLRPLPRGARSPEDYRRKPDRELLQKVRRDPSRAPSQREELVRRGLMVVNVFVFSEPFNLARWNAAKGELFKMGDAGRLNMALTLIDILFAPDRRRDWEHARFFLAETGEIGLKVLRSVYERGVRPGLPHDDVPIFGGQDKVIQIHMTLIQMGPTARKYLIELSKGPKSWERRCLASAIGNAKAVTLTEILEGYTDDPDPLVRATTYVSLGKLPGEEPLALLSGALNAEKDELALEQAVRAITSAGGRSAVPRLVKLVDHPNYPTAYKVMQALRELTKMRGLQTPAEWQKWWEKKGRAEWEKGAEAPKR